jgi:hypothetical protein
MLKLLFSELKTLPLAAICEQFSKIPLHENEVCIEGDFRKSSYFEHSHLPEALSMLPLHVKTVKFSGKFQYVYHKWCPSISGTYYRGLGEYLGDLVANLPAHVNGLKLKFIKNYQFENSGVSFYSTVVKEFVHIFQKIPSSILSLDLNETSFEESNQGEWLVRMYTNIPKTIKSLKMHNFPWSFYAEEPRQQVFEYFSKSPSISSLYFSATK